MGLKELIDRLERDAGARVATIEADAALKIEAIGAEAERASSVARDLALAALRAERRAKLAREAADAMVAARADRLRAQYALLERVMARAAVLLEKLVTDEAYVSTLPGRLGEALRYVEGRRVRVQSRPELARTLRSAVAGRADVTVEEVAAMPVGFRVVACDGSVEVSGTLLGQLERLRPRLLIELLAEVES